MLVAAVPPIPAAAAALDSTHPSHCRQHKTQHNPPPPGQTQGDKNLTQTKRQFTERTATGDFQTLLAHTACLHSETCAQYPYLCSRYRKAESGSPRHFYLNLLHPHSPHALLPHPLLLARVLLSASKSLHHAPQSQALYPETANPHYTITRLRLHCIANLVHPAHSKAVWCQQLQLSNQETQACRHTHKAHCNCLF
jgi:hypothetical protein